jgi:YHS domain-containing protein
MAETKKISSLGLEGFDAVSYFVNGKPRPGKFEYKAQHDGLTYCFCSQENLDKFNKSPGQFLPQFGGKCAFAYALGGSSAGSAKTWKIVGGKLYLTANHFVGKIWEWMPAMIGRGHSRYLSQHKRR